MDKIKEIEFFPWNDNFETDVKEIDEQHKVLVELLNKLGNTLTNENYNKMEKIFEELSKYADYHFYCEELIWEKYFNKNELLIVNHKKNHDSFMVKVLEIKEKNKESDLDKVLEEVLMFLIKWLAFHILDEDKRLAYIIKYVNEGYHLSEAMYKTDILMNGSMKVLIDNILTMYNSLSSKALDLIRERKARIKAQEELSKINKRLEELSITDQLTGLYNRRYFEEIIDKEIKSCKKEKNYLGIILFDIDYFKKLNDTYGHQQGDVALKSISKCMKKIAKKVNNYAFRLGGEEFCIITIDRNKKGAYCLSKILKDEVAKLRIENINSPTNKFLTISIGVESLIPSNSDNLDSFMLSVDRKLYQAKDNGRDCIVF